MSLKIPKPFIQGDTINITVVPRDVYSESIIDITDANQVNIDIVTEIGGEPVLSKTLGDGVTKVDVEVTEGTVKAAKITIPPGESYALLGNYFYEIEIYDQSDNVATLRNKNASPGTFTVCEDIVNNTA